MPDVTSFTAAMAPVPETEAVAEHTLAGDVRTHEAFHSRFLATDRTVMVYLPPGYDVASAERYPVLYLQDGQNLFDRATSFGEEWQVDEAAERLIAAGEIEPLIIVGIYNTGEHRVDEYTPTAAAAVGRGGHADDYGHMLIEELKPFIDSTYKTLPSAASTAIGGSSLGGLVSLHVALRFPTAFGRIAALSPSVWWDDRVLLREVEALAGHLPIRIWLDAGTAEGAETLANTRALRDALVAKGWTIGDDLAYLEEQGGEHNEHSWSKRVERVLTFLFPPPRSAPNAS